jgi:ABC-2 type transport system ATP-binding protein
MTLTEAQHFRRNVDWASTLVLPIPSNARSKEVHLDGVDGGIIVPLPYSPSTLLIGVKDEMLYSLQAPENSLVALESAHTLCEIGETRGSVSPIMSANNEPAIDIHHLRKTFDSKVAVQDLTLTVQRGEVFGFLGPNGAGKTTSVKMLLGLISPSSGEGQLLGSPLGTPEARQKAGFLPEHFRFHDWLTAFEFLKLHAELYRMSSGAIQRRVPELLELVGLGPHTNKKLRTFSKGMLQRIGLAQALLNFPELVILDEPTSGLDPVGRRLVRDIIRDLSDQGTTVFLNSHLLSEVEITCDRVAFIKKGEIVHMSELNLLVEGELTVDARVRCLTQETAAGLARWGKNVRQDGENLSLTLTGEADLPAVHRYLVENGVEVYTFHPHRISLEDLFIQIVGTDGGL